MLLLSTYCMYGSVIGAVIPRAPGERRVGARLEACLEILPGVRSPLRPWQWLRLLAVDEVCRLRLGARLVIALALLRYLHYVSESETTGARARNVTPYGDSMHLAELLAGGTWRVSWPRVRQMSDEGRRMSSRMSLGGRIWDEKGVHQRSG